jgi:hypothetical protein
MVRTHAIPGCTPDLQINRAIGRQSLAAERRKNAAHSASCGWNKPSAKPQRGEREHARYARPLASLAGSALTRLFISAAQKPPRLDVAMIFLLLAPRRQQNVVFLPRRNLRRNDVPDVLRYHVDGKEIDLLPAIRRRARLYEAADISFIARRGCRRFHLQPAGTCPRSRPSRHKPGTRPKAWKR